MICFLYILQKIIQFNVNIMTSLRGRNFIICFSMKTITKNLNNTDSLFFENYDCISVMHVAASEARVIVRLILYVCFFFRFVFFSFCIHLCCELKSQCNM